MRHYLLAYNKAMLTETSDLNLQTPKLISTVTGGWVAASLDDTRACAVIAKGTLGLRATSNSCLACYADKVVGRATGINAAHLPSSSFHTLGACCTICKSSRVRTTTERLADGKNCTWQSAGHMLQCDHSNVCKSMQCFESICSW